MLAELTARSRRVALVGLAKNTGKTVALTSLIGELHSAGERVGVTSIGRDGEEHDVIDFRIAKPRVALLAGDLIATTDALLAASELPYELIEETDVRTPLGRVRVARLQAGGELEVAGPSSGEQLREVCESMLAHGAARTLIDGAIDRRAPASPRVADGLVLATGAVLGATLEEVVLATRRAVELVRLPVLAAAEAATLGRFARPGAGGAIVADDGKVSELPARYALTAGRAELELLLDANPDARRIVLAGAVTEAFLTDLAAALRARRRELALTASDPTHIFLAAREPGWLRRQGLELSTLAGIELLALTVNPVAPLAHRFASRELREAIAEAVPGVPVLDVLHPEYRGAAAA
jgi:hypothetical protein